MEEVTTKSGMSTGMVIGIAVLVAIVFGGGAYAYVNNKATKEKKDLNAQITDLQKQVTSSGATSTTTTPTSSTSTAADPTASWKTYTSSTYGYNVKYPADWTVALDGKNLSINSPENQALKDKIDNNSMYGEGYAPTVMIQYFESADSYVNMGNPQTHVTKSVADFFKDSALNNSFKQIKLNNQTAYERESGGFSGTYYDIVCEHGSHVYDIQVVSEKKSLTTTENQIISSFQFTK